MDPWWLIFIKYFFFLLVSFGGFYLLGWLLFKSLRNFIVINGFYSQILFYVFSGMAVLVIACSIWKTGGKTVSIGYLLFGLLFFYELRAAGKPVAINGTNCSLFSWKKGVEISVVLLLLFSWQAWNILKTGDFPYVLPGRDLVFSSDISQFIWNTGQENFYTVSNVVSEDFYGTLPYHYFEYWLAGGLAQIFGLLHILTLWLVIQPLFFILMLAGILSILEHYRVDTIKWRLFALGFLFFGAVNCFPKDFSLITVMESPLFNMYQKLAHYYPVVLIAFLFFLNGKNWLALIMLLLLPILSITLLPGVIGGVLFFLAICFLFRKKFNLQKQGIFRISAYALVVSLFLLGFYKLFGNMRHTVYDLNRSLLALTDLKSFEFFWVKYTLIEWFIRASREGLKMLWLALPLMLLVTLLLFACQKLAVKRIIGVVFGLCFCIYLVALLYADLFYKMADSWQFYDNIFFFVHAFFIVTILILLVDKHVFRPKWKFMRLFTISILLLLIGLKSWAYVQKSVEAKKKYVSKYSDGYLVYIMEVTKNSDINPLGAYLKGSNDYLQYGTKNIRVARLGQYSQYMTQLLSTIDLSVFEVKTWWTDGWEGEQEKVQIRHSTFYQYVEKQKLTNTFKSIEQSQMDFIDEFNIQYVIVSPKAEIPSLIAARVKKEIKDVQSGERFLLLSE